MERLGWINLVSEYTLLDSDTSDNSILVILIGLMGYACAVIAIVQMLFKSSLPLLEFDPSFSMAFVILTVFATGIAFFIASILVKSIALKRLLFLCKMIAGIGTSVGTLLFVLTDSLLLIPIIAVGLVAFVILWALYLSTLQDQFLTMHNALALISLGLSGLFTLTLPNRVLGIISAILFSISWLCLMFINHSNPKIMPRHKESIPKYKFSVGKLMTLSLFALMSAAALVVAAKNTEINNDGVLALCIAIAAAGFVILTLRLRYQRLLNTVVYRGAAAFATVAFLPIPFVTPFYQNICAGLLLFFALVSLVIFVESIYEANREKPWTAIATILQDATLFLVAMSVALIVFWQAVVTDPDIPLVVLACFAAVIISNIFQFLIDDQMESLHAHYEKAHPVVSSSESELQQDVKGGIIWKAKIDYIAQEFSLSPRQREIMSLLIKGRDSKHIMNRLHISRSTAKTHISNIYRKIDIHSRQDLLDLVEQVYIPPAELWNLNADENNPGLPPAAHNPIDESE